MDERAMLMEFLAGRDVACPRCGYNLRGTKSDICPECSALLSMLVGEPDCRVPRRVMWAASAYVAFIAVRELVRGLMAPNIYSLSLYRFYWMMLVPLLPDIIGVALAMWVIRVSILAMRGRGSPARAVSVATTAFCLTLGFGLAWNLARMRGWF